MAFVSLPSFRQFVQPGRLLSLGAFCLLSACSSLPERESALASDSPVSPPPPIEAVEQRPVEELVVEAKSEAVRIRVAAVGDIMLGTDYPKNTLPDDDGVSSLSAVKPVLAEVDLALGNLEGVLMDGGKPVKQCQNPAVCYLFRTPIRYAAYLADAGFHVMNLANNHARDFGEVGRSSSMAALDLVGIAHTGRIGDIAMMQKKERQFAVIGFAPNLGAHSFNDIEQAAALVRQLTEQADIVIVMFHGGAEGVGVEELPFANEIYQGEDRGDVVAFSRAMVDAGADLVFGSGPHVPRAVELYKDRLIAYSLGNFATHFGIGIAGNRGLAPLLIADVDGEGRFEGGRLVSFIQARPNGPQLDPAQHALHLMRTLSEKAFPTGDLVMNADGRLSRRPPATVSP